MADFTGLFPVLGPAALKPAPTVAEPAVRPVETAAASGGASGRMDRDASDGAMPDARSHLHDEAVPTGPPPAFQVSLLDLEGDLQRAIARIEAERGHAETSGVPQGHDTTEASPPDVGTPPDGASAVADDRVDLDTAAEMRGQPPGEYGQAAPNA